MQEDIIGIGSPASVSPLAETGEQRLDNAINGLDKGASSIGESEINPIEEAKKILGESKRVLEETKKERMRIEKATAEMLINGRSYAGQAPPKQETADEKWAREAKIRYAGTGMCPC